MQIAGATSEDGRTDLISSRKLSPSRMTNHRNKQALYEAYKVHMCAESYAGVFLSGSKESIPGKPAPAAKPHCTKTIQKTTSTSYNKKKSEHKESKCKHAAKQWMKTWQQQGLVSEADASEWQHTSTVEKAQQEHNEQGKSGHNKEGTPNGST